MDELEMKRAEYMEKLLKMEEETQKRIAEERLEFERIMARNDGFCFEDIIGGRLILLGGRPAMGKTAFAISLINQIGVEEGRTCLYFTSDETRDRAMCRFFETMDGVYLSSLEWLKYKKEMDEERAYERINKMNVYIEPFDYESAFRIFDISKNVENPELIVVDGLRTFFPEGMSEEEKKDKADSFMTDLKQLAEEVDCPVVLVTDLLPSVDERENKRPVLEDFDAAGCETVLADTVIGLYRDSYYTKPSAWENGAELVILKYDGVRGYPLKVTYSPHTGLFRDEEKLIEKKKQEIECSLLKKKMELNDSIDKLRTEISVLSRVEGQLQGRAKDAKYRANKQEESKRKGKTSHSSIVGSIISCL